MPLPTFLRGGKGRQWEGGIREPFYLKAPGVTKSGSKSSTPVNGIDWYPTLLELCGIEIPKNQKVDGVSLVPLLKGENIKTRSLYWHYPHYGNQGGEPSSMIMEGDWKLIHYHEDGRDELYNLVRDIGERHDLAKKESERAQKMRKKLDAWLKQTNAKFPSPDPKFDSASRKARWENIKSTGKQGLEKRHASFWKRLMSQTKTGGEVRSIS